MYERLDTVLKNAFFKMKIRYTILYTSLSSDLQLFDYPFFFQSVIFHYFIHIIVGDSGVD